MFAASALGQARCTQAELDRAEVEAGELRAWDALYRSYKLYARCNDVSAAEGYSESVARILVDHWRTLPRLAEIAHRDEGFLSFVLGGVNATLDMKDVARIRLSATKACPQRLGYLCAALVKRAVLAKAEDDSVRQK